MNDDTFEPVPDFEHPPGVELPDVVVEPEPLPTFAALVVEAFLVMAIPALIVIALALSVST